ncbi:hypothetical protein AHAS_Ahas13G0112500 [Arachis hypogaea]
MGEPPQQSSARSGSATNRQLYPVFRLPELVHWIIWDVPEVVGCHSSASTASATPVATPASPQ